MVKKTDLEALLIDAFEEAKERGYGMAYVSGRISAKFPDLDRAICLFIDRPDFVALPPLEVCGKVCSGVACTEPKGSGCPDCTVSLHDVGAPE